MNRSRLTRTLAAAVVATVAALGVAFVPTAANAATPGEGWLRLGHLSPDTKAVDVRVSALSGGSTVFSLSGVKYGDVSSYTELPTGSYAVSMVAAGAAATAPPVISATVDIADGSATTVAAYGPNQDLQVKAFSDDLTQPSAGDARIRLIQASTLTASVNVATSTGSPIATGAVRGSATNYAQIPAGKWTLQLTGGSISDQANVSVAAGSVTTLFVLDTADGGLTILPVLDSAASAATPRGGVDTGGGYLGTHDAATTTSADLPLQPAATPRTGKALY